MLLVININLCRKLENIERKRRSARHEGSTEKFGRKKQFEKTSSNERLQDMERAPSGGWTFHEEYSKNSRNPQSFASSPLLPVWDVFVHVDSPHESPALLSVSKQQVGRGEPFLPSRSSCRFEEDHEVTSTERQNFVSKSLPHQLFPSSSRHEELVDSPLDSVTVNNNNEDESNVWVRRSHLKLETDRSSSPRSLPAARRSSLAEV